MVDTYDAPPSRAKISLSQQGGRGKLVLTKPLRSWIEVELVDEAGKPAGGEPYRIELPDGEVREGTLDEQGFARVDDLPPALCKVVFPERRETEWYARAQREPDWLEFTLLDHKDRPMPDEPFRVKTLDGAELRGQLDAEGKARVEDVDSGFCVVEFLNIDERSYRDV